jgi:hypothetical protein
MDRHNGSTGALLAWKLWAPLVLAAVLLAAGSFAMMMLPESAGRMIAFQMCFDVLVPFILCTVSVSLIILSSSLGLL